MELMGHIENIHQNSRKLYGAPRVTAAMKNLGHTISRSTVSRWMSEAGLAAKTRRRFRVVTTDSNHKLPVAENILDRQFSPAGPGAVLASDITYISTMEGWLYLAITLDLYSRRVVGWSLGSTMEEKLVLNALTMALGRADLRAGAIHHSDRGSQYAANEFRKLLTAEKLVQSMSRKGNCWDNAPTESFFHTLKTEHIYFETFATKEEARKSIFEYIEVFYNRQRLHSTLGYNSPVDFEREFAKCA
jgi:transposase InsO family protein